MKSQTRSVGFLRSKSDILFSVNSQYVLKTVREILNKVKNKVIKNMKKRKENKANSVPGREADTSPESLRSLEKTLKSIFGCRGNRFNKPGFSCQELESLLRPHGIGPLRSKQNVSKCLHILCTNRNVKKDRMNPNLYRSNQKRNMTKTKVKRKRINQTYESSKKLRREANQRLQSKIAQSKSAKEGILKSCGVKSAMATSNKSMKNKESRGRVKSKSRNRQSYIAKKSSSQKRKKSASKFGKSCCRKSRRETSTRRSKINKKLRKSSSFHSSRETNSECRDVSKRYFEYLFKAMKNKKKNQASKKKKRKTKSKKRQRNEKRQKIYSLEKKSASKGCRSNQSQKQIGRKVSYRSMCVH